MPYHLDTTKTEVKKTALYLTIACWLLTVAACTSEALDPTPVPDGRDVAVGFNSYVMKPMRSGATGAMTGEKLQATAFGVFCYYTGSTAWSSASVAPNFMYNQQVTWNGTQWTYTPVKYWPNDNATADSQGATGSQAHSYLSFFAYAPYVATASGETGITAMTTNATTGAPKLTYAPADSPVPSEQVDLLWGVAASDSYGAIADQSASTAGLPLTDLTKPTTSTTVDFNFLHATSRLKLQVQGVFDEGTPGNNDIDGETRILVNSISVTAGTNKGVLNLQNTVANVAAWESTAGIALKTFTLNNSGTLMNAEIRNHTAIGTYLATASNFDLLPAGVTKTAKNAFADDDYAYLFIPTTTSGGRTNTMDVRIQYDVITRDPALVRNTPAGFSIVHNDITRTVTLPGDTKFDPNKLYKLNILLGMTSVKFDLTVTDWTDSGSTTTISLPENAAMLKPQGGSNATITKIQIIP